MLLFSLFVFDRVVSGLIDSLNKLASLDNMQILSKRIFPSKKKLVVIVRIDNPEYIDETIISLKNEVQEIAKQFNVAVIHDVFSISTSEPLNPEHLALARFYYDLYAYLKETSRNLNISPKNLNDVEFLIGIFLYYLGEITVDVLLEVLNWIYDLDHEGVLRELRFLAEKDFVVLSDNKAGLSILGEVAIKEAINKLWSMLNGMCTPNSNGEVDILLEDGVVHKIRGINDFEALFPSGYEHLYGMVLRLYAGKLINYSHIKAILKHIADRGIRC